MIYRSYFRKKKNKIYMIVLSVALAVCLLLSSFIEYYNDVVKDVFTNRALVMVESNVDAFEMLNEYEEIANITRVLTMRPNNAYAVFGFYDNHSVIGDGIIMSGSSDENINEKIKLDGAEPGTINGNVVVRRDDSLNDGEMKLGLAHAEYDSYDNSGIIKNTLNKVVGFYYKDKNYEFVIKDIYETKFVEIKISEDLFDELVKQETKYTYVADILEYETYGEVRISLQNKDELADAFVSIEAFYNHFEANTVSNALDLASTLQLVLYVLLFALIIFLIVVNKNQINDLNKNMMLEYKVGYSKSKVKINTFKRLFMLFTLSFVIALLLLVVVSVIINMFSDITLSYPNVKLLMGLYICVNLLIFIQVLLGSRLKKGGAV